MCRRVMLIVYTEKHSHTQTSATNIQQQSSWSIRRANISMFCCVNARLRTRRGIHLINVFPACNASDVCYFGKRWPYTDLLFIAKYLRVNRKRSLLVVFVVQLFMCITKITIIYSGPCWIIWKFSHLVSEIFLIWPIILKAKNECRWNVFVKTTINQSNVF